MGRVAPRRRHRRRRALPPRMQSHVGGRPPSVLKYPGSGEPSSRAAMPLLSTTTTLRARFSSPVFSLYSLFLPLTLFLPSTIHALLPFSRFLCVRIFPGSCARRPRSPLSPQPCPSLSCVIFPSLRFRAARSCSRVPSFRIALRSLPLLPPINPSARSTYSGAPSGMRFASLRSAINRRARNAAQPRERCVNWKAPGNTRISRTFGRRWMRARAHASMRCTELRNPGITRGVRST